MTLGQIDKDIILGRSQNQAVELLKTEMLISRYEDDVIKFMQENKQVYGELVEQLFNINCEQHERLCRIQQQKPQQPFPVKKPEPVKQNQKISDKQKACPQCSKPMPKSWQFHTDCGWNVGKAIAFLEKVIEMKRVEDEKE
jgi:hypothetical protein